MGDATRNWSRICRRNLDIMLKNEAKSLSELIGGKDSPLRDLAVEARRREQLSDYLRKHLSASLVDGFLHCNMKDETTLVVIAASPEWASRLRFEAAQLIRLCAQQGTKITAVKVRVAAL